jgi:hypothetical protein
MVVGKDVVRGGKDVGKGLGQGGKDVGAGFKKAVSPKTDSGSPEKK